MLLLLARILRFRRRDKISRSNRTRRQTRSRPLLFKPIRRPSHQGVALIDCNRLRRRRILARHSRAARCLSISAHGFAPRMPSLSQRRRFRIKEPASPFRVFSTFAAQAFSRTIQPKDERAGGLVHSETFVALTESPEVSLCNKRCCVESAWSRRSS